MSALRILAAHQDASLLDELEASLDAVGVKLVRCTDALRVVPEAREHEPHLILLERAMPVLTAAEICRGLRAFEETERVPLVFLVETSEEEEALQALREGATDVLTLPLQPTYVPRIMALLEEMLARDPSDPPPPGNPLTRALLDFYRRDARHGTLVVNKGTPFEGRATFDRGELGSAHLGPLDGREALDEMLVLQDGVWRFVHGQLRATTTRPHLPTVSSATRALIPYQSRVLVVDDDEALRRLFERQLGRAGFRVNLAGDGQRALEIARETFFDVVLADLHMPRLDGWGLLQQLKADPLTREVPVVFISAHDNDRDVLEMAQAGAADYLSKTGHSETIVPKLERLLRPRVEFWDNLAWPDRFSFEVHPLGMHWMLRALAQQKASGILALEDAWGSYGLTVRDGLPLAAHARAGNRLVEGLFAVASLLVQHGARGTFTPQDVHPRPALASSMAPLIDAAGELVHRLDAQVLQGKLANAHELTVDPALFSLYRRVGSAQGIALAQALAAERMALPELGAQLGLTHAQLSSGLSELLGRGILRLNKEPAASSP